MRNLNEENVYENNWYCWPLKEDLIDLLDKYGQSPFGSIEEGLQKLKEKGIQLEEKDQQLEMMGQ